MMHSRWACICAGVLDYKLIFIVIVGQAIREKEKQISYKETGALHSSTLRVIIAANNNTFWFIQCSASSSLSLCLEKIKRESKKGPDLSPRHNAQPRYRSSIKHRSINMFLAKGGVPLRVLIDAFLLKRSSLEASVYTVAWFTLIVAYGKTKEYQFSRSCMLVRRQILWLTNR